MTPGKAATPPWFDAAAVTALSFPRAVAALREALRGGLDPEAEPARSATPLGAGELLCMPSTGTGSAGVKLVTVLPDPPPGVPRIRGLYVLVDAATLAPTALLDGAALTLVRTPAVSALAVDLVAPAQAHRLVVFGAGPQAHGHVHALRAVRPVDRVTVVGRDPGRARALADRFRAEGVPSDLGRPQDVAEADLVACCTTATTPLFDGRLLPAHAVVVACGSHRPTDREVDSVSAAGGVVVESRVGARSESGVVVQALRDGTLGETDVVTLADLVTGRDSRSPRLIATVGMSWEDLAVAAAVVDMHRAKT